MKKPASGNPIGPETIHRAVLPNGITVLVYENFITPAVTLRGRLQAGGMYDPEEGIGLANLTASSVQRGTAKFTFQAINERLDRLGMAFGIGGNVEVVGFSGRALVEDLDAWLEIASQVLIAPTFPPVEVEKVRVQILTRLEEAKNDTQQVADRRFRELCYPAGHPYHRPQEGIEEGLKRLTLADLAAFHGQYYRPETLTLAISGAIPAGAAVEKVERAFGQWRGQGQVAPFVIPDLPKRQESVRQEYLVPGKTQSDIVIGFPGLARRNPDYYPLMVADLIFGQMGLMGRLGASVRDRDGLAYYVYSSLEASYGAGPWVVRAGVNPANVERAIAGILAEMRRLRDAPVSADELQDAQDFLTGSLALRLETNNGIAAAILDMETFDLGLDYLQRYPGIVRAITPEAILEAVRRYQQLEGYVLTVAGPAGG